MNSRAKRSDAGYGLRRVLTKRRWDEDFEYYFSKMNPEGDAVDAVTVAHAKRPVGRPRKQPPPATEAEGKVVPPVVFALGTSKAQDVVVVGGESIEGEVSAGLREEEVSSVEDYEDVVTLEVETSPATRTCMSDAVLRKLCELGSDDKVECNVCHKLLKPSSVRQHVRTHYGVKPYGCFLCDAKFTRKGDVDRHIRIVHYKDKPFKCCKCQRGFGDRRNLRWHLKNHDKKLFYVCDVCGFKFGKRVYWENHVRYIHPLPGNKTDDDAETLPPPAVESEGSADDPDEEVSETAHGGENLPQSDAHAAKGVETVIIHLKPAGEEDVPTTGSPEAVVYQIEDPQEILQLLQVRDVAQTQPEDERLVEVAVGEEGVRSVEYVDDLYGSSSGGKVCKITLAGEDRVPSLHGPVSKVVGTVRQADGEPLHYKLAKIQAS